MTFTLPAPVTRFVAGEDVVALHRAMRAFRPAACAPDVPFRSWFACSDAVFEPLRRAVARVELGLLLRDAQLVREGDDAYPDPDERFDEACRMVLDEVLHAIRTLRTWDPERPLAVSGGRRPLRRRRHLVLVPGAA